MNTASPVMYSEKMNAADKKAYGTIDKKYQAESDVYTLTEAKKIKKDNKRMKCAMHCAKEQAKNHAEIANSLNKED